MIASSRVWSMLRNTSYLQNSLTFLLFFASWGIWWSFFQIWLTNETTGLGLSGSQVGTIYSVNSVGTLVIMLGYGMAQDKLGTKRHLAIAIAVLATCVGPFVMWVYRPLLMANLWAGAIVGAVVLSAGFMAASGLLEALAERFSRKYHFEYGQSRAWGSFGYAVVALLAGFLFTINPAWNFWLGSVFGALLLAQLLLWRSPDDPAVDAHAAGTAETMKSTPGLKEMASIARLPHLWLIIGFVFLSWTFYNVFDQQMFPDFYTKLFDTAEYGQQTYGVLNSVQVFLEAAMMGVVPLIMRRIGVKNTLMLGILVMFLRITGCAVFHSAWIVSFVKLFHALEVPLCILPVFRYFTLHFNPALSATLYMVGFQIASQVGTVVLSQPLGALRDAIGYQPTFFVIAAIVACAGVYGFLLLKRDDVDVQGDPFVRGAARASARPSSTSDSQ